MLNCGPAPFSSICVVVEEAQVHNDAKASATPGLACFVLQPRPVQDK